MTTTNAVQLKGSLFTLTVLQLGSSDIIDINDGLNQLIQQSPTFFENAPIVIDITQLQGLDDNAINFGAIKDILREYHIFPVGVRGANSEQQEAALTAELAIFPTEKNEKSESSGKSEQLVEQTTQSDDTYHSSLLISQPVRSGQKVYAKNADLIITAPVSNGAEVLADGNIHIYGPLRGRALAGVQGDVNARIFCQKLEAQLVAIAGQYLVNEQDVTFDEANMIQIYIDDDRLKIAPL